MRNTRSCVKRDRPDWWTPEGVLARLQDGQYVGTVCAVAADEIDRVVSAKTLRADIAKWEESASWGPQFKQALSIVRPDGNGGVKYGKAWHDEFFKAMEAAEGNTAEACESCGVSYGIVLALTDRRNKCYDKEFHERFRIAEMPRLGKVREKHFAQAIDKDNFKAQEKILSTHLPHMYGETSQINVSGEVEVKHGMTPAMTAAVLAASQARTSGLFRGRRQIAAPVDVVEGEVLAVKEGA